MGIEIKIWANPAGFAPVTRQLPSVIFTEEENKNGFNPDRLDPIKTSEYFSIYYAQQSYVVSYHFYVTVRKVFPPGHDFRDKRTVLSVAIPRGYSFENGAQTNLAVVLGELKNKYEELVNSLSSVNDLTNALGIKGKEWIAEYSRMLVKDEMQPIINLPGTPRVMGYVVYRTSDELRQFLEAPVRMEFKGASLMLLLPEEAAQQYSSLLRSFAYVKAEPKYSPKFSVYFPAFQEVSIAIISSLEESIDKVCEKPECEPIHLKGKYADHMYDWKMQLRSDKTGYTIGLQFSPKIYRYRINLDFVNAQNRREEKKDVDRWLVPSIGRIEYNDYKWWFVVEGEQNKSTEWKFSLNKPSYQISQIGLKVNNELYIKVDEWNYFDVPELQRVIHSKYHFMPKVFIRDNRGAWQPKEGKYAYKGNPGDNAVMIDESEGYEKQTFPMSVDFNSIRLKEKSKVTLNVVFTGEILSWLDADDKRMVTVREWKDDEEKKARKKKHKHSHEQADQDSQEQPQPDAQEQNDQEPSQEINLSKNELTFYLFEREKCIRFKAPGFKPLKKTIQRNEQEIILRMKPTLRRSMLTSRLVHMLLCLIVGYALGCFFHHPWFDTKGHGAVTPAMADTTVVRDTIYLPEEEIEDDDTDEQPQEEEKKQLSDVVDTKALDGIEFTHQQLSTAMSKAMTAGIYEDNKAYFDDRNFALNVVTGTNKNPAYINNN